MVCRRAALAAADAFLLASGGQAGDDRAKSVVSKLLKFKDSWKFLAEALAHVSETIHVFAPLGRRRGKLASPPSGGSQRRQRIPTNKPFDMQRVRN